MAERERDARELTPEQKEQIKEWILGHWKGSKACPICADSKWDGPQFIVQHMTHAPLGNLLLGGGPAYPLALVTCTTCGYTMSFNAVIMGVMPKKEAANVEAK